MSRDEKKTTRRRVEELVSRFIDHDLTREQEAVFDHLLEDDGSHVAMFRDMLDIHALLVSGQEGDSVHHSVMRDIDRARGDSMVRKVMDDLAAKGAGKRRSFSPAAGKAAVRYHIPWGRWISIAACLVIAVGAYFINEWQGGRVPELLHARVLEAAKDARVFRNAKWMPVHSDMPLYEQDMIDAGDGGRLQFKYNDEDTRIDMYGNTQIEFPDAEGGKRIRLKQGRIDCDVAKQPANESMKILTVHAEAEVVGTRFGCQVSGVGFQEVQSKTKNLGAEALAKEAQKSKIPSRNSMRLDVFEGLVRFTRLSDKKTIDVAGGQYAVAADGVVLVALAISEQLDERLTAKQPAESSGVQSIVTLKSEDCPKPRTHLDGKILFEDDFDGPSDKWEIVTGNSVSGFNAVTTDLQRYWNFGRASLRKGGVYWADKPPPSQGYDEEISMIVVNNPDCEKFGRDERRNRFVGVRSLRSIDATRFVVEIRCAVMSAGNWDIGVEVCAGDRRRLSQLEGRGNSPTKRFVWHRWEFEPTEDAIGGNAFICRYFKQWEDKLFVFCTSDRVISKSMRMLFSFTSTQLCIDRVVVKEMNKDRDQEQK